ncbi:MAG TPA: lipopolysaccharide biosynthesis protein [Aquihabitans sp.]|nr:lipopolysaccharide biosynthesis protein [Aquihabitans sp.]
MTASVDRSATAGPTSTASARATIGHVGWSTVGTLGARFGGAAAGVVAAHLLGPAGRGQYAVLVAVATVLAAIATGGLQFWVVRQVADPASTAPVRAVIARHVTVVVTLGVVGAVAAAPALVALDLATAPEVLAAGGLVTATATSLIVLGILNGRRQMRRIALATSAGAGGYLGLLATLGALDVAGPATVTAAAAAGQLCIAALCLAVYHRLPRPEVSDVRLAHRAGVRFGWPAALGEIMVMASLRADIVLVAALLGREDAGHYAVALALAELMWVIPDGAAQVVLPMAASGEPPRATSRLIGLALLAQLVAGVALVVAAPFAVDLLFGDAFEPAARPMLLLVIASFGLGTWKLLAADVVGRGDARARGASTVVGLVLMVAADLVLIPRLGLRGAALGAGIGYWAAAAVVALAWRAARREAAGPPVAATVPLPPTVPPS